MITIGSKVKVFDHRLYKNDIITPISYTMKPATVVNRYCYVDGVYSDVVDVIFDYRPNETSKHHFTSSLQMIS